MSRTAAVGHHAPNTRRTETSKVSQASIGGQSSTRIAEGKDMRTHSTAAKEKRNRKEAGTNGSGGKRKGGPVHR